MNPLRSHWLRLAFWLLLAMPLVAFAVVLTADDLNFAFAFSVTLYMWLLVSGILALIAFAGLLLRLMGWGIRAIRR
ncbi:MAG: hypothetical protein HYX50_04315 [Chloroflexi bacterium]|nr:hypothetical protein [Chloroflexota bacterium]